MLKLLIFSIFILNSSVSISQSSDSDFGEDDFSQFNQDMNMIVDEKPSEPDEETKSNTNETLADNNESDSELDEEIEDDPIIVANEESLEEEDGKLTEINSEIADVQKKKLHDQTKIETLTEADEITFEVDPILVQNREPEILDQLSELRKNNINEIITVRKRNNKNKYTNSDIQALRIQLKDIAKSPLFIGRLTRGVYILDLKTQKKKYLTKDINVKVHKLADYDKYLYIINKKGELKYRVYNSSVQNISNISNLNHRPKYFSPVKSVQKVEKFDKNFNYAMNINFHGGFNFPRYTRELLTDTTGISTQTRVEIGFLTKHDFLLDYGFSGMYEAAAGSLSANNGRYTIKTFSLGPVMKTKPLIGNFQFTLASRMSVISDVLETRSTVTRVHKLSEISLSFGMERQIKSAHFGLFTWGANFQRKWLRAKAQNVSFNLSSTDNYDESITLYIGHQSGWTW
jgi:hypothetical protein